MTIALFALLFAGAAYVVYWVLSSDEREREKVWKELVKENINKRKDTLRK